VRGGRSDCRRGSMTILDNVLSKSAGGGGLPASHSLRTPPRRAGMGVRETARRVTSPGRSSSNKSRGGRSANKFR
jgi:hypothetical protein